MSNNNNVNNVAPAPRSRFNAVDGGELAVGGDGGGFGWVETAVVVANVAAGVAAVYATYRAVKALDTIAANTAAPAATPALTVDR
jgi:hypothetical protein